MFLDGKQILLFGEEHQETPTCFSSSSTIPIQTYIEKICSETDEKINLFLEIPVCDDVKYKCIPSSVHKIDKHFKSIKDTKFYPSNLTIHNIDLRFTNDIMFGLSYTTNILPIVIGEINFVDKFFTENYINKIKKIFDNKIYTTNFNNCMYDDIKKEWKKYFINEIDKFDLIYNDITDQKENILSILQKVFFFNKSVQFNNLKVK